MHTRRVVMAASHCTRGRYTKCAFIFLLALGLGFMAITNIEGLYSSVCGLDNYNARDITSTAPNDTGPLEFPKLSEWPICSPWKNWSVPNGVCRSLQTTMKESKRQTFLRLLKYFDEMATKHGWTYFIGFGTLLGSWRHHDVIPWDYDMDLMIEYKYRMDIVDKIDAQERFVPRQCTHDKIRLHDRDHITGTTYAKDVGRWYSPSIDMFFFVRNETHIRRSDYPTWFVTKLEEIFPLHRRPLSTLMLPSPRDSLKFLRTYYGNADTYGNYGFSKCEAYKPYLPFVHRKWKDGKMEETLILNGKKLHVKLVKELYKNMPLSPYTLAHTNSTEKGK